MSVNTDLSKRELRVLRGMADGKSNSQIGREMYLAENTVKTYARTLFKKLEVGDRAHAVAVAYQAGLLGAEESPAYQRMTDLERRVQAVLDNLTVQFSSPPTEFQRGYRTCEQKVRKLLGAEVLR